MRMTEKERESYARERIVARMNESGWPSQEELAEAVGCSQGALSQLIIGMTGNSKIMPKLADIFAVNLAWLEGFTHDRVNHNAGEYVNSRAA
jgi:hypothetical protein